jgi:hypothetical protein
VRHDKQFAIAVLCAFLAAFTFGPANSTADGAPAGSAKWYRGNTHAHTVICGHADSTPEVVAQWYLDHGYHFLCLSEHNHFIDPATVKLPEGRREDFILIPGEEITGKYAHMTGLNLPKLVGWASQAPVKSKHIQDFVDWTRQVSGVPIINHPNFTWALSAGDIRPVNRCYLFELFNGHPSVHNEGDATHPSTEQLWDTLLTDGMVIYGVSSDDAHHFKEWGPGESNAGRGWVMVRAAELAPDPISAAMDRGDFYASNGVFLKSLTVTGDAYALVVDPDATAAEVRKPEVLGQPVAAGETAEEGCRIEFIGPGGKVMKTVDGHEASCDRDRAVAYLRARVTVTRKAGDGGQFRRYRAWTQPVFHDGRLEKVEDENVKRGWTGGQ